MRGCLLSSRLMLKSLILRETCPNFQFFVKIPICIASYFVFWCFNCVTTIVQCKEYTVDPCLQAVFAVIYRRFCKVCAEKWQNSKILNYFKYIKIPENAFSGYLGVLKSKVFPLVPPMVPPQVDTGFIINLPFWAP